MTDFVCEDHGDARTGSTPARAPFGFEMMDGPIDLGGPGGCAGERNDSTRWPSIWDTPHGGLDGLILPEIQATDRVTLLALS